MEGRAGDLNTAVSGPSSVRHQNAIETAFRWRADVGPTSNAGLVFQGIQTSITKPYILVVFQGEDPQPPPPPHLNRHMECMCKRTTSNKLS